MLSVSGVLGGTSHNSACEHETAHHTNSNTLSNLHDQSSMYFYCFNVYCRGRFPCVLSAQYRLDRLTCDILRRQYILALRVLSILDRQYILTSYGSQYFPRRLYVGALPHQHITRSMYTEVARVVICCSVDMYCMPRASIC